MSVSKFFKEAITYRLLGGHVADHAALKKQNGDPIVMNQTASQKYRFFFPCQQQSGTYGLIDSSGNYADAVYNQLGVAVQAESAYWANKGYATVGGGANCTFDVAPYASGFDMATQSFILSGVINMAAPAANTSILGNANLTTGQGIYISMRTSGKLRPIFNTSTGILNGLADSTFVFADNTDHHFSIAYDALSKSIYTFADGSISDTFESQVLGSTTPTLAMSFGSDATGASTASTKIKGMSLMVFTGALPTNFQGMIRKAAANPLTPLTDNDVNVSSSTKRVFCVIGPGQSNEVGAGISPGFTREYGLPIHDPVGPNGSGLRSMWPALTDMLGKRGVWFKPYNLASGSTCITHTWCGILRAWVSSMLVTRGTYVLANGNVFKSAITGSTVGVSTVQPTGTVDLITNEVTLPGTWTGSSGTNVLTYSTTIPGAAAVGMGISGAAGIPIGARVGAITTNTITIVNAGGAVLNLTSAVTSSTLTLGTAWTYMGAARVQDVAGYIYPYTDAYFDPNGMLGTLSTGANSQPLACGAMYAFNTYGASYNERWAIISIGQGDKTMGDTLLEYRTALQNVIDYYLHNNIKVLLGFTNYGTSAGMDAWMTSNSTAGPLSANTGGFWVAGTYCTANPATDTGAGVGGWYAALQNYSGNLNVATGANLRYALGVLPSVSGSGRGIPGIQSDFSVHMNDAAYNLASIAWRNAIVSAGWA